MDLTSIIGIILGISAIVGGQILEGGRVSSILQPTAAIIVFGGTFGAALLQFPLSKVIKSLTSLMSVFFDRKEDPGTLIETIIDFSKKARREGILTLEKHIKDIKDPFFKKALSMAIDGLEPKTLYETMETELATFEEENVAGSKFFEAAGGYAPTIGILGAVLGLIHVMENLSDPSKLGAGIAVAFVATVYGVGSANLIFLPIAGKLKQNLEKKLVIKELIIRGVMLIQEGTNHSIIEEGLVGFLNSGEKKVYEVKNGKERATQT